MPDRKASQLPAGAAAGSSGMAGSACVVAVMSFDLCKRRARRSTPARTAIISGWTTSGMPSSLAPASSAWRSGESSRGGAARTAIIEERTIACRGDAGVRRRARAVHRSARRGRAPRAHRPEPVAVRPVHRRPATGRGHGRRVPPPAERSKSPAVLTPAERLRAAASTLAAAGVGAEWIDGAEAVRREPALATAEGRARRADARIREGLAIDRGAWGRRAEAWRDRPGGAEGGRRATACRRWRDAPRGRGEPSRQHRCRRGRQLVRTAGRPGGPPVTPLRGQLLQLRWHGAPITRVLWSELCYVVPWADGTVLVGATVEDAGFDQRTTVAGVRGVDGGGVPADADSRATRRSSRRAPGCGRRPRTACRSSAVAARSLGSSTRPATIGTASCWRR